MLCESASHPVSWEAECVNCSVLVVFLVVVYHKFFNTISVDIGVGNRVSCSNSGVNGSRSDECSINGGNSVEAYLFIKELSGKYHNLVLVLRHLNDLDANIGTFRYNMLSPC